MSRFILLISILVVVVVLKSVVDEAAMTPHQKAQQEEAERNTEAERLARRQELERVEAENKLNGKHCLEIDGSHLSVDRAIRRNLKDPDSYEFIESMISEVDENAMFKLYVKYRAKNSFGGFVVETVSATVSNETCNAEVVVNI